MGCEEAEGDHFNAFIDRVIAAELQLQDAPTAPYVQKHLSSAHELSALLL